MQGKTVVVRITRITKSVKIKVNAKCLEEVKNSNYLGSEITSDGKIKHKINRRIQGSSNCYR